MTSGVCLQVRSKLNGQIMELMEADVLDCLPRYCLPTAIARVCSQEVRSLVDWVNFEGISLRARVRLLMSCRSARATGRGWGECDP